jgi:DedD protein
MDRRVKERLVGATILIAIVVLVVPELLSGPKPTAPPPALNAIAPQPIRNVTVDLATSKAPVTPEVEPPVAAPPPTAGAASGADSAPGPAASSAAASSVAAAQSTAAPSAAASAHAAAPVETPLTSPISAAHWAVQLGSFANRAHADNFVHQLKAQGLTASVSSGGSGRSLRYRVRMGPFADREAADRTAARLKSLKHDSTIVAPGS